jgi:hypothetical protein
MLRQKAWILGGLTVALAACAPEGASSDTKAQILRPDGADVSLPLTELAKLPVPEGFRFRAHEAEPVRLIPHMHGQAVAQQQDPVVQSAFGTGPNIPTPIATFEGQGAGLAGFTVLSAPPDTDGDVGPNHYVQIVNTEVTIFNKQGTKLFGPVNTNTFFANFPLGPNCQNTNDGDGVVRYDRMADRWVISQVSVSSGNGQFFQCIAVSTSPDPTGTYTRYQFSFNALNDYPKMGLWPDAYYFTYNLFPNNQFAGARVCAADRKKMLAGDPTATQQCFDTGPNFGALLASDLDGPTLPPAGEPNLLLALDTNALDFFKFHVDFWNPANSTFTGVSPALQIPVQAYTPLCNGGICVKQPGTTQQLDSLADRLMNRLVYRNFGDHEALLVSHAVTRAGGGGGVRFYELRLPGPCTAANCPTPTIFQQGTYAPDASFRWMSSAAFDVVGDIAACYSTSSSTINPSIRYAGRLPTDTLGMMGQGEATLIAGTGSQAGNQLSRWGDYISLNIDPSDDCTFWCTAEYIAATGSFNWHTRIGRFKFANCGPDFSITSNPTSQTVVAGSSTTFAINTTVLSGTAETVMLTVAGLPAGVTTMFTPMNVTAGLNSTLTVTVPAGTAASTSTLTITGTAPSKTHTTTVSLIINPPPSVTITSPTNGSTVSGTIIVSANATDTNGTVTSVRFDLPDGTSVSTASPFSTTFDTTKATNGNHTITATATDNQGATSVASVTVTVFNCIKTTFSATGLPSPIPDNNSTGITSTIPVIGNGTVGSLSLALSITHTFPGDLIVTLQSPSQTIFTVSSRNPASLSSVNLSVPAFNGEPAAGTWTLAVEDVSPGDVGTLNSWSLAIVGTCN